jgi:hemerythrin-like domain-containing protein
MKATDALLADHKLVRKLLEQFHPESPRFGKIALTLHRALQGHAWFEDEIFLPAVKAEPLFFERFNAQIAEEHRDIEALLRRLREAYATGRQATHPDVHFWGRDDRYALVADALQLRALLESHFRKEEDGWFPLAEHVLTEEGLLELGAEMKRRQTEIRKFLDI